MQRAAPPLAAHAHFGYFVGSSGVSATPPPGMHAFGSLFAVEVLHAVDARPVGVGHRARREEHRGDARDGDEVPLVQVRHSCKPGFKTRTTRRARKNTTLLAEHTAEFSVSRDEQRCTPSWV